MSDCWCIREIISFLQINKNGNTSFWLPHLSWVGIKQQLPKELSNLTRQVQRCLRSTLVAHKCKSGYLTADELPLLRLRCLFQSQCKARGSGGICCASQEAAMQVQGFGAGRSSAALPLAQGSSRGAGKAGRAGGTHQLVQLSVQKYGKRWTGACSSLLSTPLQILLGHCTVTAQRKIWQ